ncbi:hypothetical protein [Allosphingosinicella deserti]|uniref:hypothetical protein n=1 Tax=Allosphingosinicella deserti TaxID=2116704 RepID=UPI001304C0E9|nr:hypothetical protein [Sphingomonas deserti]
MMQVQDGSPDLGSWAGAVRLDAEAAGKLEMDEANLGRIGLLRQRQFRTLSRAPIWVLH